MYKVSRGVCASNRHTIGMASLQIPFSRWDWPNSETLNEEEEENEVGYSNHPEGRSRAHNHNHGHSHSRGHSHAHGSQSKSPKGNHRSAFLNCSHPKSNPIAASLSSLSAMLLEGHAVLAHQTPSAIWLFIGLRNGSIWKWSINLVIHRIAICRFYILFICYSRVI